jgi:hypothetical protein
MKRRNSLELQARVPVYTLNHGVILNVKNIREEALGNPKAEQGRAEKSRRLYSKFNN